MTCSRFTTGAKPDLGPNCMIFICGIIQFGPKTGLAPVRFTMKSKWINRGTMMMLCVILEYEITLSSLDYCENIPVLHLDAANKIWNFLQINDKLIKVSVSLLFSDSDWMYRVIEVLGSNLDAFPR